MAEDRVRGKLPPTERRDMEVRRILNSQSTTYVCFSEAVYGQWIHWFGGRSHECTSDKKACNGCARNWAGKWRGYLHVQAWGDDDDCFIEITTRAWHLLDKQIPKKENLRGVQFRIYKTKGGPKGRFVVEVLERRAEVATLRQEKDPYPTLKFLWSCKRPAQENQL